MINEVFEPMHLQERKVTTPLFNNAREAFIGQAYGHKFHSKYLVIDSRKQLNEYLFREGNICPIFIYHDKSYIFQEGQSLHTYFLARKETDFVLYEEEIWKLLAQISRALQLLREMGYNHRHLKEYTIRRISADLFKLVFHPTMNTAQELIRQKRYNWFDFYLPPEQLKDPTQQQLNSCVFSLGALLLNLMNPLDFKRDIYSRKDYSINQAVVQEKIDNASLQYSTKIMDIIKKMLVEQYEYRITLGELVELVQKVSPFTKKQQMTNTLKSIVNQKLEKSREKSNSPPHKTSPPSHTRHQPNYVHRVIKFERGTFGGNVEDSPHSEEEIPNQRISPENKNANKQKGLTKNDSEFVNQVGQKQKPSQRSYSQYIDTVKKVSKDSPESKGSEGEETKAQSGRVQMQVHLFTGRESEKDYQVEDYNEYMARSNTKKPQNELNSREQQQLISPLPKDHAERQEPELSRNGSESNVASSKAEDDAEAFLSNHIYNSVQNLESKVNGSSLKLSQCLEEPAFLARRMGAAGVWINGNVYYGQFKSGRRNGLALQIFQNNEYYYGHYKDDMFHGEGFYFWNNQEHYLGTFEAGAKLEGSWLGKNKYIGQIKDNKRHGIGKYIYSNGTIYEGEWYAGKRHGQGIITQPTGEKFVGTFRMGKKWGHGTYLVNGCRVSGVWDGEEPVGPCQIHYQDGRLYKGPINGDFEMHGKEGELQFPTGSSCKGQFKHDEFIYGQILYRNGERYKGEVREMRRHGKGCYTYIGGKEVVGEWRDNVLVVHA